MGITGPPSRSNSGSYFSGSSGCGPARLRAKRDRSQTEKIAIAAPAQRITTITAAASMRWASHPNEVHGTLSIISPDLARLLDVDAAFEVGSVLDHDTGRLDVADELRVLADVHFFGGLNATVHFAHDDHFACFHTVRLEPAVRTDGQAMAVNIDRALYVAINGEVFLAMNFAFHLHILSENGNSPGGLGWRGFGRWRCSLGGLRLWRRVGLSFGAGFFFGAFVPHFLDAILLTIE